MRRILRARANEHRRLGWMTAQQHIATKANDLADPLSHDRYDLFVEKAVQRGISKGLLQRLELDGTTHARLEALLDDDRTSDDFR